MLSTRVSEFLTQVLTRHEGQTLVIGSHGGTIHHLFRNLIDLDLHAPPWLSVHNASVTRVDLVLIGNVRVPQLVYVNRICTGDGRSMFE